jgi:hypothetical protein
MQLPLFRTVPEQRSTLPPRSSTLRGQDLLAAPRSPTLGTDRGQVCFQTRPYSQAISLAVSLVNGSTTPPWWRRRRRLPGLPLHPNPISIRELVTQLDHPTKPAYSFQQVQDSSHDPGNRTDPGCPIPHPIDEDLLVKMDRNRKEFFPNTRDWWDRPLSAYSPIPPILGTV